MLGSLASGPSRHAPVSPRFCKPSHLVFANRHILTSAPTVGNLAKPISKARRREIAMRRLMVFLAVTGTMLPVLMVGLASPATATIRTNETFVLHRDSAGNTVDWSASGTFTDSG